MAFDVNDPADLAALKSEIETDPLAHGYDPNDTAQLLGIINDVAQNLTVPSTVERSLDDVAIPEVSEVIDEAEYAALGEYDKDWTKTFIAQPAGGSEGTANITLRPFKGKFLEVFPNGSNTRAAAQALLTVEGSRGESLFGFGTTITRSDWIAARDS